VLGAALTLLTDSFYREVETICTACFLKNREDAGMDTLGSSAADVFTSCFSALSPTGTRPSPSAKRARYAAPTDEVTTI
jgi:hypothetical protein